MVGFFPCVSLLACRVLFHRFPEICVSPNPQIWGGHKSQRNLGGIDHCRDVRAHIPDRVDVLQSLGHGLFICARRTCPVWGVCKDCKSIDDKSQMHLIMPADLQQGPYYKKPETSNCKLLYRTRPSRAYAQCSYRCYRAKDQGREGP